MPLLNEPPGGGGKDVEATTERAAESSLELPEDFETEAEVTRPLAPIEKAMMTRPLAPEPALALMAPRRAESRAWTIDR